MALTSTVAPAPLHLAEHARHHIARRLLPFLFVLYIANYIDRTNLAYAALGLTRDLGFTDRVIGLGVGIFFITYVAGQIPGALLVEHWSARRMIAITMVAWGLLTIFTARISTANELYLVRILLGVAEASFFPGVVVYLSHWFIQEDRAKAGSNFMAAIPLSFVIGSPLAGWLLGRHWLGLSGWRWLFVLEGIPAILLGAAAFFYLTDWPREAAWLAPQQREWIQSKLREEEPAGMGKATAWQALSSPTVLLLAATALLSYLSFYSVAFWLPTMLKNLSGLSDVHIGLLGAIPYIVTFIAMQINGWHSDRKRERHWHAALPLILSAIGAIGILTQPHSLFLLVTYFSLAVIAFAFLPVFFTIPSETLSQPVAAAAVGMINAAGSIAGFVGPYSFGSLHTRTGSFAYGLVGIAAAAVTGAMLILYARRKA